MPLGDSALLGDFGAFAGEFDAGLAGDVADDFDVGPGDAAAPTGSEDFEDGFLGGESAGEMFEISLGVAGAIFLFGGGKDAVEEALAVLLAEPTDAVGFDDVNAVAENGHLGSC